MLKIRGYDKIEGMGLIGDKWLPQYEWKTQTKPLLWIHRITETEDRYVIEIRDFHGDESTLFIERGETQNMIWESKYRREPINSLNYLSSMDNTLLFIESNWRVDHLNITF